MHAFLTELRRRKVTRSVIAYGIAAFAIMEGADIAAPRLGLPDATVTWVVWLAVLGLPVVIAVSWYFEISPEGGIAETTPAEFESPDADGAPADADTASSRAIRHARGSGALAAAVVLLLAWSAWTALSRSQSASASAVVEGAERIAILPFRPAATDPELTRLGRNLVVTMSTAVEAIGEIRASDPTRVLNLVEEEGGPFTPERALALARELGATAVVSGSVVRSRDGAGLEFRLLAADDGREIARGSADADALDLYRLTDAATVELMRGVWREGEPPTENLEAVTTESIEALTAFLEGERYFRLFQFEQAVPLYERAVQLDTTFALPHWRLDWMNGWTGGTLTMDSAALARHQRLIPTLPPRERMHAMLKDAPTRTALIAGYERLTARYPDYAMAQFQLGDYHYHYAALLGLSLTAVDSIWEIAIELGADDQPARGHYLLHLLRRGDPELQRRWWSSLGAPRQEVDERETLLRLVHELGPPSDNDSIAAQMADTALIAPLDLAWNQMYFGSPAASARALARIDTPPATQYLRRQLEDLRIFVPAANGRFRDALDAVRALETAGRPGADLLIYRIGMVAAAAGVLDAAAVRAERPTGDVQFFEGSTPRLANPLPPAAASLRDFIDGYLALLEEDAADVQSAIDRMRERGATYLPRSLELQRELRRGTAGAVDRMVAFEYAAAELRDMRSPDQVVGYFDVVALNRRAALRELLTAERYADAERLSRVADVGGDFESLMARAAIDPLILPLRGRALEGLGRTDEARDIYAEYLRRMVGADAAFADEVAAAREAIDRLGG